MVERANLVFHNKIIDGTAIKRLIRRLIDHFGMAYTSHILDQIKTIGFQQATETSISLGIDDLLTIPSKGWLVQDAEKQSLILEKYHHYGNIHAVEKLRQSIEIWYATSEYLRQEMNSNFRMTDPFNSVYIMSFSGARGNASQVHQLVGMRGLMSDPQGQMIDLPIQSNLREGLSLTEYIISCYGARKGVVDTAVRTSDAGYLTRRLVEVVQHIIIRRTDCGTIQGIYVIHQIPEKILIQTLIGRVLADYVYIGPQCIATRNQDLGVGLIDRFITFQAQPISIRTPFTCKGTSWICRLCYGRSSNHGDLVELGEAVGIIAGQSIGEPGTQLTLRTFHTGGVFTGGIAGHVRASSNGKIRFNEDLVHPTRTRHGHPAFLCYINLYVTIESKDIIQNIKITPKSFLLVQNDQYIESEQAIAEIRAGIATLNFKERVRKHIYSNSEGEMHWSTNVYHESIFTYSSNHLLLKTSHLWVLTGDLYRSIEAPSLLHKDQDQMKGYSHFIEQAYILNLSVTKDHMKQKSFNSGFSAKKEEKISNYSKFTKILYTDHCNFFYTIIFTQNYNLLAKKRKNRFIIPFQLIQKREKELMSRSDILIKLPVPINGVFHRKSVLVCFDDPQYKRKNFEIPKYKTVGAHSIVKKVDRFFCIPEEAHIIPESYSIMVRNNSIVGIRTRIALNTSNQVGGLVQVERKKKKFSLIIFSGDIHFMPKIDKIVRHSGVLIPPGVIKIKLKNWIYVQRITPTKKRYFVLVRPVVTYEIASGRNLATLFPQDLLPERDNVKLQVVNYTIGNPIEGISSANIQLIRTCLCLVLNWNQDKTNSSVESVEEASGSFVEVRITGLIRDFFKITLVQSPILYTIKRESFTSSSLISNNGSDSNDINPFFYRETRIFNSLSQNQGTINTKNLGYQSLIILSSSDYFRMNPFDNLKYRNMKEKLIKKDGSLGPIGRACSLDNFDLFHFLLTHNDTLVTNFLQFDSLKQTLQVLNYYFTDENGKILNSDLRSNTILNPFDLNWYFLQRNYCEEISPIISIGQFICENICIAKNGPHLKSGQVLIVQSSSVVIRSAKPYLITPGATVHGHYGEILSEGNILVTFIYEKSKSGDITQGLPKIEQVLEVRSFDSISMNLERQVKGWNGRITRILGIPWRLLIGAELIRAQSHISLINKIQKIYRSQGVQIHNKHIEMVVRQITSKVLFSEYGMSNVFLPGELISLLRAERAVRALEEVICYQALLLGITRTSLNTQSFLSEASFQETARVLSKASLRGRIDWLKGLKENVVLGRLIPVGTGFKGFMYQLRKYKKTENIFGGEMRDILFYYRGLFDSCILNFKDLL